jgi:hypothetical protein
MATAFFILKRIIGFILFFLSKVRLLNKIANKAW